MLTLSPFLKKVYIGATFQGFTFFADRCGKGYTSMCLAVINSLYVVNVTNCVTICLNDSTNFTEMAGLQFKDKIIYVQEGNFYYTHDTSNDKQNIQCTPVEYIDYIQLSSL